MPLPLFPLNTVLFPGCPLDLQLFEPRYLDMLSRCLKQGTGFGVVSLLQGREAGATAARFASIGCEALIRDWQQQANGLLSIRVEGARRFRVERSQVQADQLHLGEVTWLEELPDTPVQAEQADLLALLKALVVHPLVETLGLDGEVAGQQALANRLAYLLPLRLEQKLELLALAAPDQRLQQIQLLLERLQDNLQA